MDKIMNIFTSVFNAISLSSVNEGPVGLSSFEKPVPDRIKRPELPEDDEPIPKTSFTGLLRRAN
ncbi:MAG: hypothetical protein OSJ27_10155 [Candidatus Gastranaerophilales bacterium]|nr:hypothetical protein [Candidatus Gastranaerophilales bacterium]